MNANLCDADGPRLVPNGEADVHVSSVLVVAGLHLPHDVEEAANHIVGHLSLPELAQHGLHVLLAQPDTMAIV